jgi:hypothetical protein
MIEGEPEATSRHVPSAAVSFERETKRIAGLPVRR